MQKNYICKHRKDVEFLIRKYDLDVFTEQLPIIISVRLKEYPNQPYNWCNYYAYNSANCKNCVIGCKDLIDLSKLRELKLERILNEY